MSILSWFDKQVRQMPKATAIIFGDKALSYAELDKKAEALSQQLLQLQVKKDSQVALCIERSIDQAITILAILKAGAAYVPLDPKQPLERLNRILKESQVPILVTHQALTAQFQEYHGQCLCLESQSLLEDKIRAPSIKGENLAYVIYTSGTTGTPKGVLIEHRSVENYCQWFAKYSKAQVGQRIDWSGNYIFDMTVSTSIVPLMLGMTIVMCKEEVKKDPEAYLAYLQANNIDYIKISPSYFKELLRVAAKHPVPLPHLKNIILGGENLLSKDCRAWLELYPKHLLFNEYGPSEATVAVTYQKIDSNNVGSFSTYAPIGKAEVNTPCSIINEALEEVAKGEVGELIIGGVCLARGYANQPKITKEKFIKRLGQRWYKTGDLCRKLEDDSFEILGRIDEQFKIRGFRVEPGEIEVALREHPAIEDAKVLLCQDLLVAYCIMKEQDLKPSYPEMRKFLETTLPEYMIPNSFIAVTNFPLTASGKLDFDALPKPFASGTHHFVPAKRGLEKKLAAIWSQELGVKCVGMQDNFFELGGNSLNAARIVSEINKKFKKLLTVNDFYQAETLSNLKKILKTVPNDKRRRAKIRAALLGQAVPFGDFQLFLWILKVFEPNARKLNLVSRKRWHSPLDKKVLEQAFQAILKRHEVLSYRPKTWYPAQYYMKKLDFKISEKTLSKDAEVALQQSMTELMNFKAWSKQNSQLIARVFHLPDGSMELQICLPHAISDDMSLDIFWADLAKFYNTGSSEVEKVKSFHEYIVCEKNTIEAELRRDCLFWKQYLDKTRLFKMPASHIVPDMKAKQIAYSTYQEIPGAILDELAAFCAMHKLGLNALLCAAVSLSLKTEAKTSENNPSLLVNIVKSTRDNTIWDHTIGCFIRLDPVPVKVGTEDTLLSLAKQIHQTIIETTEEMQASVLLKLAYISAVNYKQKWHFVIKALLRLYGGILQLLNLKYQSLQFIAELSKCNRKDNYLICLNLRNNFTQSPNHKEVLHWKGLEEKAIQKTQDDLEDFDNVCDISFLRDQTSNIPYVVVSSNLQPDFRKRIAMEIVRTLKIRA